MSAFLRKTSQEREGEIFYTPKETLKRKGENRIVPEQVTQEREKMSDRLKSSKERLLKESLQKGSGKNVLQDRDEIHIKVKDEQTKKIETILEEDLTDLFLKMTPEEQILFKETGEQTASKIRILLSSTKINVRKILSLIRNWLSFIPGVNYFFLEQETKIKTDRIMASVQKK
jgi:hypothetical protein